MHFIWVGGPIPDDYSRNIQQWQEQNPEYEVNLWIDTGATKEDQIPNALQSAEATGARVRNLADSDKNLLNGAKNARFYNEEVVGQNANYAAASDILRLEILKREGGIYVDTDLPPKEGIHLGQIEAQEGFMKPPQSNDFICAVPESEVVNALLDGVHDRYESILSPGIPSAAQDLGTAAARAPDSDPDTQMRANDASTNEKIDLHRDKAPFKLRTETTLEMTGPDLYRDIIQKTQIQPLIDSGRMDEAVTKHDNLISRDLESKFENVSDQTWRDKGPQDDAHAKQYFTQEYNYRFRQTAKAEINDIADKIKALDPNNPQLKALSKLGSQLSGVSKEIPASHIISDWKKEHQEHAGIVDDMESDAKKVEAILEGADINLGNYAQQRDAMRPSQKFAMESSGDVVQDMNKGLREGVNTTKDALSHLEQSFGAQGAGGSSAEDDEGDGESCAVM